MDKYTVRPVCGRSGIYRGDKLQITLAHSGEADRVVLQLNIAYAAGYGDGYAEGTTEEVDTAYCKGYRAGVDDVE